MSIIAAGIIALLYVLGVGLGRAFVEVTNSVLEMEGLQLGDKSRISLTYLWPVGAAMAMYSAATENDEGVL